MKITIVFLSSVLFAIALAAQPVAIIPLENPSFEDIPRHSTPPGGWDNCGFEGESPTDIHPTGEFGVEKGPAHGKAYLGMVVRDNDTWECIGQPLVQPLLVDTCYHLDFLACRSEKYISLSRATNMEANYNTPVVLRLWAGYAEEGKEGFELLAESQPIANLDWEKYELFFTTGEPYDYLYLEAYFGQEWANPYNGNVLVDGLSGLVPCSYRESDK